MRVRNEYTKASRAINSGELKMIEISDQSILQKLEDVFTVKVKDDGEWCEFRDSYGRNFLELDKVAVEFLARELLKISEGMQYRNPMDFNK